MEKASTFLEVRGPSSHFVPNMKKTEPPALTCQCPLHPLHKVEFPGQTDRQTAGGPLALTCPRPLHPLRKLSFRDRQTDGVGGSTRSDLSTSVTYVTKVEFPGQTDHGRQGGRTTRSDLSTSATSVTQVEFPGQTDRRTGGGAPAPSCPRPLHPLYELSFRDGQTLMGVRSQGTT